MANIKIGDKVWFFYIGCGKYCWGDDTTVIYPSALEIQEGMIVYINEQKDCIHVYVEHETEICNFGYVFHRDYFFNSKQEAIEEMINRLEKLKNE